MGTPFLIQLIVSFLVGGAATAILSILAERSSARVAGFLLSLPTTVAIGIFFIGWTLSPQAVVEAVPVMPLSLGIDMAFTPVYVAVATLPIRKTFSVTLATCTAIAFWMALALPIAIYQVTDLTTSLLGYAVLTTAAHVTLRHMAPATERTETVVRYTTSQKLFRALLSGSLISLIVYLSKTLGPVWGGVFSMFPAANISAMTIIHWRRGPTVLARVCRMIPLGSPTFLVYAFLTMVTYPTLGIVTGTIVSYLITAAFLLVLADTVNPDGKVRRFLGN